MNFNKICRPLVCLLLICCILVNCSPIRAKAIDPVTTAVTSVGYDIAIRSIAKAVGIGAGETADALTDIVNKCGSALELAGLVVDGCVSVMLKKVDSGFISYFPEELISAVIGFMYDTEVIVDNSVKFPVDMPTGFEAAYNKADAQPYASLIHFGASSGSYWEGTYAIAYSNIPLSKTDGGNNSYDYLDIDSGGSGSFSIWYSKTNTWTTAQYLAVFDCCGIQYFGTGTPKVSTALDIMLNNVAPIGVDLATGYPDWYGNSITVEDAASESGTSTYLPVSVVETADEVDSLTQTEAQAGTISAELAESLSGALDDTFDGSVATTPWATFTQWVSAQITGVVSAVTAIPAAITDFFTFDTSVDTWAIDLTDFFPFCIPYDIYDFLSILAAEPEAPVFHWEIPVPQLGQTFEFDVDLTAWDGVARLFRSLELLAFIVGLAYVTREKFIRG